MSSMNAQLIALSAKLNSKPSDGLLVGNASQTETIVKPTLKRNLALVGPIRLHEFDILMPLVNVRIPFMFKMACEGSGSGGSGCKSNGSLGPGLRRRFESVAAKLKASLAEALELYPPVAGTICISPDDESAITIVCDARGATFMTQIEERKYDEYDESMHLVDELAGTNLIPVDTSRTLFSAKLTLFTCGTMVLVTTIHHYLADLTSYMDFVDAWNKLSRGDDLGMTYTSLSWSRQFNLHRPAAVPATIPGVIITPPSLTPPPLPALRIGDGVRWFISNSNLAKLKADCTAVLFGDEKQTNSWISSGDALTALVWGAMTRARHAIPNLVVSKHAEIESLSMAVNGRERMPGFEPSEAGGPSRYFGNLNLFLAVFTPRENVLEANIEATSRAALSIRKALHDETTQEAIAGRIAFIEAARKHISIEYCDCMSTNWSKYDFVEYDFGLGPDIKSVGTKIGTKTLQPVGMIFLMRVSEGLVVNSIVEKEADELLKMDPILTRYAEAL